MPLGKLRTIPNWWVWWLRRTSSAFGAESCWEPLRPSLTEPAGNQDQVILQACLPQLKPEEADKLAEMLETDFLHLIQLMEFGASGLFGGGIPKNPFREYEG